MNGTPKTLDEAIFKALTARVDEKGDPLQLAHGVLKDFMAQHFQIAILEMENYRNGSSTMKTPEEILTTLFDRLTRRQHE